MAPTTAFWHLLDLFAPALGLGAIAAGFAKLLWRSELASVAWGRLAGWSVAASALVVAGGLVALGRDGKMATYAAMVAACALTLWWVGFARRR